MHTGSLYIRAKSIRRLLHVVALQRVSLPSVRQVTSRLQKCVVL